MIKECTGYYPICDKCGCQLENVDGCVIIYESQDEAKISAVMHHEWEDLGGMLICDECSKEMEAENE